MTHTYEIYDILEMTSEEISKAPSDLLACLSYKKHLMAFASIIQVIPYQKWEDFTEEQLAYLPANTYKYLDEDLLLKLYNKFKDSEKYIPIQKKIKDKQIPIYSEPVSVLLWKAIGLRKKRVKVFKIAKEYRQKLLLFNQEKEDSYIPIDYISQAYMLKQHDVVQCMKHYVVSREDISLEYENSLFLNDIIQSQYDKFVMKRDFIEYLSQIRTLPKQLNEIPDIQNMKEFLFLYKIDYLLNSLSRISNLPKVKENINTYMMNSKLYEYNDMIQLVAYTDTYAYMMQK